MTRFLALAALLAVAIPTIDKAMGQFVHDQLNPPQLEQ